MIAPPPSHPKHTKSIFHFNFSANNIFITWRLLRMCKVSCFHSLCVFFIITLFELNMRKVCCRSHWLDAESGRSPNNGCTLHQWEHPFQQSVPHMALRPLLHALSRQRVSFMLQDRGSLRASWPSDQLFWSDLASWQRKTFLTHIFLKNIPKTDLSRTVWGVESTKQVIVCARTDAGDLRLDNACN